MNRYTTIHNRKKRGGRRKRNTSEEKLIEKARAIYNVMKKEKIIKDLAKSFDDISLKVDLVGTPEVSFIIAVENGKLKFLTDKRYTDMAIGIHKNYFLELVKNPPKWRSINLRYNNIIFRKGVVRMFKQSKSLFSKILTTGTRQKEYVSSKKNKVPKDH